MKTSNTRSATVPGRRNVQTTARITLSNPLNTILPLLGGESTASGAATNRTVCRGEVERNSIFSSSSKFTTASLTILTLLFLTLTGCAVGPNYHRPAVTTPVAYKEPTLGQWKESTPQDQITRGTWWELFNDKTLNDLEQQATLNNQELKAAVARVTQARATARVTQADFFPNLQANPSAERERTSPNAANPLPKGTFTDIQMPVDLSYEVDIWGRVRRSFEAAKDEAQASLANFETILLTLKSDVAQNYFRLRALDAEIATVTGTVALRKDQLELVRSRFNGGIGNELDTARAETELATTEAEAAALAQQRAELENAIALLVGTNPSSFHLTADTGSWHPAAPEIPAGLPADLLERRPDVATAERQLAAANARIGVAKAAFFPVLTLTGSGGFVSADVDTLFNWNSRTWSLGPSLSLPIFAGGRNRANLQRSKAAFEESVANYRQQILVAFGEVENSLSRIRHLADQTSAQTRALTNARQAAKLATERYRSGIVNYLEVVDAEREALQIERDNARLSGQRLIADVQLIKALGGTWKTSEIGCTPCTPFAPFTKN